MSEPRTERPPERTQLLRGLAAQISRLDAPLRVLAEDILGLDSAIDLVAVDGHDRVVLILVSENPDDLGLFTRGLAQRAWLSARLPDWLKLAPGLAVRVDAGVRLLLLAPDHPLATRSAAASLEGGSVELLRYGWLSDGVRDALWLENTAARRAAASPTPARTTAAPPSSFRSGLSERDLGLTPEELRELG